MSFFFPISVDLFIFLVPQKAGTYDTKYVIEAVWVAVNTKIFQPNWEELLGSIQQGSS